MNEFQIVNRDEFFFRMDVYEGKYRVGVEVLEEIKTAIYFPDGEFDMDDRSTWLGVILTDGKDLASYHIIREDAS